MSLYRKWRPQSFADLVGQTAVVRTLETALRGGKLAHAYLFSGPRGSGKTSAAKILARCINCRRGPTPEPDNNCDFCTAMLAGTALDVLEIDAASNRGIEEIRAIREAVKFPPAQMRSKVYIIDEAHMLTREGANAFLKTLEEPPPHVVFVLATTAPEALPPTILSRCQRYAFGRIATPAMIERMRTIAAAEQIPIDDAALGAIAYRADGGLRDALTMLEQVAAYAESGRTIDATTVDAAFGSTGREQARAIVDALIAGDAAAALRAIDSASDGGTDMQSLIRATIAEFRHLMVARIDPGLLARDLAEPDARAVRERAAAIRQPRLVRALRLLSDALGAARTSGNARLELETAVLRFVVVADDPSLDALAVRVATLEAALAGGAQPAAPLAAPVPPPPMPPPAERAQASAPPESAPSAMRESAPPLEAEAAAPVTLQRVRSLWSQARLRAEEAWKPLRGPLSQAAVDALDGDALRVVMRDEIQASILRGKVPLLEKALAEVLGRPLRVSVVVGKSDPPRSAAHAALTASADDEDLLAYARAKFDALEGP